LTYHYLRFFWYFKHPFEGGDSHIVADLDNMGHRGEEMRKAPLRIRGLFLYFCGNFKAL